MEREFVTAERLTAVVRAAFGPGRRLELLQRLRGGSKKGVYRLTFTDGSTAVLYVWSPAENYWPASPDGNGTDHADPFSDASSLDLFETSRELLTTLGVRTPRTYLVDRSRTHYPADIAVVEDVSAQTLEDLLRCDPRAAAPTLDALGAALRAMHRHRSPRTNGPDEPEGPATARGLRPAARCRRGKAGCEGAG
ncbi:MAG TPA: phosphotransferase [Mycobacteriales bacterium]|nr:phosphotransferase [Mycobacteriales bacterium]